MKSTVAILAGLLTLAVLAVPASAFQELPSLELSPYIGFLKYDSAMEYDNTLAYGVRADLRFMPYFGLQFHMARSAMRDGLLGFPFGADDYVNRIQLNLTRDLMPVGGFFVHVFAGVGSFNRYETDIYRSGSSVQAGVGARRNLFDELYLRGDCGWTVAWLKDENADDAFYEETLTHHLELSLSVSYLLDN